MTDKEVIKALECYRGQMLFSFNGKKPEIYIHDIIDLINRQKDEIERLRYNLEAVLDERADHSEAIKEFAERVSKLICDNTYPDFDKDGKAVNIWSAKDGYKQIDNLLKEMVGDN